MINMVSDKIFKIAVIGLLILILGSIFGVIKSEYVPEDENYLEFEEDMLFIDEEIVFHQFNIYTFEEYSHFTGSELYSREAFVEYVTERGYEIDTSDDYAVEVYGDAGCKLDKAIRLICFSETLVFIPEEFRVEQTIEGFKEDE